MTLSNLIRKREIGSIATAIPAIPAIPRGEAGATVARIATIAVANPAETKAAISWGWLVRYADLNTLEVYTVPTATRPELLRDFPGAISAEPFIPAFRQPARPSTGDQEATIRAWLASIGETDPYTIAEVLEQCRIDADARDYFTGESLNPNGSRGRNPPGREPRKARPSAQQIAGSMAVGQRRF